tara:strand:- start:2428 stop:2709 length:282 start_codon:yes stop_codon:yes gene_type:complete
MDMATFCVEIPDADIERILTAVCANYNYNAQISDPDSDDPNATIDNPQTTYQFANEQVRKYLIENTVAYEAKQARQAALNTLSDPPQITDPAI